MSQITALKAAIIGVEGPRNGGNAGANLPPGTPLQVGMRLHLDCTPTPDSGDPADPNLVRKGQGKSPKIVWRWGRIVDGKHVYNSKGGDGQLFAKQDEPDHFSLESYERKNESDTSGAGLTPVLLLEEAFGPGQHQGFAFPCVEAAQNEGLNVGDESGAVTFPVD